MRVLLIDDIRNIPADQTARSYQAAIDALKQECWDNVLLDHDLADFDESGKEWTGYHILCWLEQNTQYIPKNITLITMNPVARKKMNQVLVKLYPDALYNFTYFT
jgi:hypothetical protein